MCAHSKDVLQLMKNTSTVHRVSIHENISPLYNKEYILKNCNTVRQPR